MFLKPRLPSRWEIVAVLVILGGLAAVAIPAYRIGQVRPTVSFIRESQWSIAVQLAQEAMRAADKLPAHLPKNVSIIDSESKETKVVPAADPYNSKRIDGIQRVKGSIGYQTGGSVGYISLSYSGNPYGYIRLSDRRAIIYSYGPDRRDDFGALDPKQLSEMGRAKTKSGDWIETLLPHCYDPSNGTISSGDIFRYIDLDER